MYASHISRGLIVGESLFGVTFAAIVGATDNDSPLALVDEFAWAVPLGLILFAGAIAFLYLRTRDRASLALADSAPIPPNEAAIR